MQMLQDLAGCERIDPVGLAESPGPPGGEACIVDIGVCSHALAQLQDQRPYVRSLAHAPPAFTKGLDALATLLFELLCPTALAFDPCLLLFGFPLDARPVCLFLVLAQAFPELLLAADDECCGDLGQLALELARLVLLPGVQSQPALLNGLDLQDQRRVG